MTAINQIFRDMDYGPAPESQEHNGWGQWIRADHDGLPYAGDGID